MIDLRDLVTWWLSWRVWVIAAAALLSACGPNNDTKEVYSRAVLQIVSEELAAQPTEAGWAKLAAMRAWVDQLEDRRLRKEYKRWLDAKERVWSRPDDEKLSAAARQLVPTIPRPGDLETIEVDGCILTREQAARLAGHPPFCTPNLWPR